MQKKSSVIFDKVYLLGDNFINRNPCIDCKLCFTGLWPHLNPKENQSNFCLSIFSASMNAYCFNVRQSKREFENFFVALTEQYPSSTDHFIETKAFARA